MSQHIEITADQLSQADSPGIIKRFGVLIYGAVSYLIGVQALLWIMLAMGGQAPVGFSPIQSSNPVTAMLINIMLVGLFGLQHSVMARTRFKQWLNKVMPTAMERPTYVLFSEAIDPFVFSDDIQFNAVRSAAGANDKPFLVDGDQVGS